MGRDLGDLLKRDADGEAGFLALALAILKNRGEQPRQRQNRLLFLAADADSVSRLNDQVTSALAWRSIVADVAEGRLNLDQHQSKQAINSSDLATEALGRMVRETYKWLLAPMQEARAGRGVGEIQWDHHLINPAVVNRTEEIEKTLREHELVISEWAPVHLAKMLQAWFWKDTSTAGAVDVWHKTCSYLYLPRLKDADILRSAINAGVASRDFFGIAYGQEDDRYQGFHFGERTTAIFDESLLLVEPGVAAAFSVVLAEEAVKRDEARRSKNSAEGKADEQQPAPGGSSNPTPDSSAPAAIGGAVSSAATKKTKFFGSLELDPVKAKLQFADVAEEVLMLFTQKPGVKVKISIEIEAESLTGFDDGTQRAVRENCNQLKFKNHSFEE